MSTRSKVLVDTGQGIYTFWVDDPHVGDVVVGEVQWRGRFLGVVTALGTDYDGPCKDATKPSLPIGLTVSYEPKE